MQHHKYASHPSSAKAIIWADRQGVGRMKKGLVLCWFCGLF